MNACIVFTYFSFSLLSPTMFVNWAGRTKKKAAILAGAPTPFIKMKHAPHLGFPVLLICSSSDITHSYTHTHTHIHAYTHLHRAVSQTLLFFTSAIIKKEKPSVIYMSAVRACRWPCDCP